ncbi:hypothetical protein [Pontiella sp.]|uniref:hypothetical protein n=1 Tax=Pontiella sp. TaxID=2837462 RepID=UPI0035691A1F
MMLYRVLLAGLLLATASLADGVRDIVERSMSGLRTAASDEPYSRTIKRMYLGFDPSGHVKTGIAYREIDCFEIITGVVVVDKTPEGYVLREAFFPDVEKIKNEKDRKQVLAVLQKFKNVPFDPHAEKSAVDVLTGATRYGIQMSGYLNYMARHVALEMEQPPQWAKADGSRMPRDTDR